MITTAILCVPPLTIVSNFSLNLTHALYQKKIGAKVEKREYEGVNPKYDLSKYPHIPVKFARVHYNMHGNADELDVYEKGSSTIYNSRTSLPRAPVLQANLGNEMFKWSAISHFGEEVTKVPLFSQFTLLCI